MMPMEVGSGLASGFMLSATVPSHVSASLPVGSAACARPRNASRIGAFMSVSNGEGTPCALMATAGKQPSSSTSHRWPLIVLIDDVAQIVERGEFPVQVSGVVVVGDCCVRF